MRAIDPITLEVLTQALVSVVGEMRATVFRTARSVAIHEGKDFSCGLFDATGQVVAQSDDISGHVVPLPWHVRAALRAFDGRLAPGDVVMLNDPYLGGTHLNDVTLVHPIFREGRLVFLAAVREHWADVGGTVPGSLSGAARDIYQEGIRIPPVLVVEAGRPNQAVIEVLLANMRVREERLGDLNSGLGACRTAERRLDALLARHKLELVEACVRANLDRSEARMRARIAALPDGDYAFEDYLETFVDGRFEPLRLPLRLIIAGDSLTADFTGASAQVPVPVNSTLAVTTGGVVITLKAALDPTAPMNQGAFRPVTVIAPEGTVANVTHPAPAGSHGELRKRVMAVMIGALSRASPERITGDVHRTSFHNMIGGAHPRTRREYVHYEWGAGGNGGFLGGDGPSAMAAVDWGNLNTLQSTEVIESSFPLLVEESRLGIGSGGEGRSRGGAGMRRAIRVLAEGAQYSVLADGAVLPAFGIAGALSAAPVASHIERAGEAIRFASPGKVGGFPLRAGDVVVMQAAGGGGYGDPLDRPIQAVLDDLEQGTLTPERAREVYGAVLDAAGRPDAAASERARAAIRDARRMLVVVPAAALLYRAGRFSERRICPVAPEDAAALGLAEDALVELDAQAGAPLRAWAVPDAAVAPGTVPLDSFGLRALGLTPGAQLHLRPLRPPAVA